MAASEPTSAQDDQTEKKSAGWVGEITDDRWVDNVILVVLEAGEAE